MSGPKRRELVIPRERRVAVGCDVSQAEIVRLQKIFEGRDGDENEDAYGHARVAGALNEQLPMRDDSGDASYKCIDCGDEGEE